MIKSPNERFIFSNGDFQDFPNHTNDETATVVKKEDYESPATITSLEHIVGYNCMLIDDLAASVANKWSRFAEEYEIAEAQAKEFKQAGYQGECSIYITSYAEPEGISNQEATDIILAKADSLRAFQIQLREQRMRKRLLLGCATVEEVEELSQEIQEKIKALGESYK